MPETTFARELSEHFGATGSRVLVRELGPEAALGRVEVIEVPQRPQTVGHVR